MSIDRIKENQAIIERVESFLKTGYDANPDFNIAINGDAPIKLRSLKDAEIEYSFEASEILYWVERDTYIDELEGWNGDVLRTKHADAIQFLEASHQEAVFRDVVEAIRKQKISPFIGAGVSCDAGYPAWGKALEILTLKHERAGHDVVEVRAAIAKYDYLLAAQLLHDQSSVAVASFVRTEFRLKYDGDPLDNSVFPPVIRLLPKLSRGCVVTTNFDRLVEEFLKQEKGSLVDGCMSGQEQGHEFIRRLLKGDRCVLKLHGDHERPDTHVFTHGQYLHAYGDDFDFTKKLPRALRQIYIGSSLLFIGCSLEQDRTLDLFSQIKQSNHFEIPNHFAFLADPDDDPKKQAKEDRLQEININPVWYRAKDRDHSLLIKLLELAVDMAESRVSLK
jgi:hypothetical protein